MLSLHENTVTTSVKSCLVYVRSAGYKTTQRAAVKSDQSDDYYDYGGVTACDLV